MEGGRTRQVVRKQCTGLRMHAHRNDSCDIYVFDSSAPAGYVEDLTQTVSLEVFAQVVVI